jgi:hypothetical protein
MNAGLGREMQYRCMSNLKPGSTFVLLAASLHKELVDVLKIAFPTALLVPHLDRFTDPFQTGDDLLH